MVVLGHVAHPAVTGEEYRLKSLDNSGSPVSVTADGEGRLWLIVGTDSGFEGLSAFYYESIACTFTPVENSGHGGFTPRRRLERTGRAVVFSGTEFNVGPDVNDGAVFGRVRPRPLEDQEPLPSAFLVSTCTSYSVSVDSPDNVTGVSAGGTSASSCRRATSGLTQQGRTFGGDSDRLSRLQTAVASNGLVVALGKGE